MRAVLFDGRSARAHPVLVELTETGASITTADGAVEAIGLSLLSLDKSSTTRSILHRRDQSDWRLVVDEPLPRKWQRRLPSTHRLDLLSARRYAAAGVGFCTIVAAVYLFGDWLLERAAPLIPHAVVEPIGRSLVAQIGGDQRCDTAGGHVALEAMVARLAPEGGFAEPVTVTVVDRPIVNAFAAPGGHVVIFSQLIEEAESPDEVAGVLAHELAHVRLRHPTQALIRHVGVSMVAQALGGNVGGMVDLAILLDRSRGAESAADALALESLGEASISPNGFADFFDRLASERKAQKPTDAANRILSEIGEYASTHPADAKRLSMIRAAERAGRAATPALDWRQWAALRAMCKGGEDTKPLAPKR